LLKFRACDKRTQEAARQGEQIAAARINVEIRNSTRPEFGGDYLKASAR